MGTKPHWTKAIVDENNRLKIQIQSLKSKPMLDAFATSLGDSIMIQLALIPYRDWPSVAKTAFNHESRKVPTLAQMYINLLPDKPF